MVEALPHNANHILHSLRRNGMSARLCDSVFLVRNAVASASRQPFAVVYTEGNVRLPPTPSPSHSPSQLTSVTFRLHRMPSPMYSSAERCCRVPSLSLSLSARLGQP